MCISGAEEGILAYVTGWLEKKSEDELIYTECKPLRTSEVKASLTRFQRDI